MTTYAVPISEKMARILASLPVEKVNAVNAEMAEVLADLLEEGSIPDSTEYPLTAEDLAAIGQGLAEIEVGQEIEGTEAMASLYQRVGLVYER